MIIRLIVSMVDRPLIERLKKSDPHQPTMPYQPTLTVSSVHHLFRQRNVLLLMYCNVT